MFCLPLKVSQKGKVLGKALKKKKQASQQITSHKLKLQNFGDQRVVWESKIRMCSKDNVIMHTEKWLQYV